MIKLDRLGSGVRANACFQKIPRLVDRLGSGVRVSDNFQIFALTAGWKFPSWGKTVLGPVRENMTGEMAGGNALHSEIE